MIFRNKKQVVLYVAICIIAAAGPFIAISFLDTQHVFAEWFNESWKYREAIRFTNSGSSVTDQKVLIAFDTATPIGTSKMQTGCQDVRFTDAAGKLLRYYLNVSGGAGVGCNDASSDFYVLMPTIVAGQNLIYIYYGNSAAAAATEQANFPQTTFTPSAGPTAASEETTPGPVGLWHFNEESGSTAHDSTRFGHHLTLGNTVWATSSASLSNRTQYLKFNGANSQASVASHEDFNFGTGSFTVSGWFRHAAAISGSDTIIDKYSTAGWKVYMNSSGFICFDIDADSTFGGANYDTACSGSAYGSFADNKWHEFEAVKNGTASITLYVDGQQVAQDATLAATGTLSSTATLYIGVDTNTNWWDGAIDEIIVYPYARTTDQVKSDTEGLHTGTLLGASTADPLTHGLNGWWKMDETSANTCPGGSNDSCDSSGNGNDGAWNGSAASGIGKFGNGVTLDGINSYVATNNNNSVKGLSQVTAAAWVYLNATGIDQNIYTEARNSDSSFRLQFNVSAGNKLHIGGRVPDSGSFVDWVTGNTTLTSGTWYHVAAVYDAPAQIVRLYLNGAVDGQAAAATAAFDNTNPNSVPKIGSDAGGTGGFLSARVDDVRLYSRALSSGDVSALAVWAPGPVGWWNLDEPNGNRADSSGNGNNLTDTNTVRSATGRFGMAAEYENLPTDLDQSLVITNANQHNLDFTGPFTIEGWFKTHTTLNFQGITGKDGGAGNRGYGLAINASNKVRFLMSPDGTATTTLNGNTSVVPETWYHAAGVWDGSNMYLYLNGVSDGTPVSFTGSMYKTSGPFGIGGRGASGVTDGFDGALDDVRVYNYVRSAGQIIEDMNGGHTAGNPTSESPVIYWRFDDMHGTTANNSGYIPSLPGTLSANFWAAAVSNCKINGCVNISNSNGTISAGDIVNTDSLSQMTLSFWFKPSSLTASKDIVSKTNFASQNSFLVQSDATNPDELRVYIASSLSDTSNYYLTNGLDLTTASLTQVTIVYNGTLAASDRVKVYRNGLQVPGSVTGTIPVSLTAGSTSSFKLGQRDGGASSAYFGYIDEFKFYNFALTDAERLIDLNAGTMTLGGVTSENYEGLGPTTRGGWWTMDENTGTSNVSDISGNDRTMTMTNMAGRWVPGKLGSALEFDGVDDYLNRTSANLNPFNNVSFTAWVKPDNTNTGTIYMQGVTGAAFPYFAVNYESGAIMLRSTNDANTTQDASAASTGTLTTGQWNFIEVSKSNTAVSYFVNGVFSTATIGNTGTYTTTGSSIGALHRNTDSQFFDGVLDNIQIFSKGISNTETLYVYNRGAPVAWYKFDECQGNVAHNSAPTSSGAAAGMDAAITIGGSGSYTTTGTCGSGTASEMWNAGSVGKFGSAFAVDGSNDYAAIADTAALDFTTDMSISAWVYTDVLPTTSSKDLQIVNKFITGTNQRSYRLYVDKVTNLYNFNVDGDGLSGGTLIVPSISTITTGVWHHVVAVFTGSTGYLYIDGKLENSAAVGYTTIFNSTADVVIGMDANKTSQPDAAKFDDVRLYNYPLTAQQVKLMYNGGAAVRFGM